MTRLRWKPSQKIFSLMYQQKLRGLRTKWPMIPQKVLWPMTLQKMKRSQRMRRMNLLANLQKAEMRQKQKNPLWIRKTKMPAKP